MRVCAAPKRDFHLSNNDGKVDYSKSKIKKRNLRKKPQTSFSDDGQIFNTLNKVGIKYESKYINSRISRNNNSDSPFIAVSSIM